MLRKLIKYDLLWINRTLIIFYILTFIFALLMRLGENLTDSVIGSLLRHILPGFVISAMASTLINAAIRVWVRFRQNCYKDEAYLTHTLPITRAQLFDSKVISSLISIVIAVAVVIAAFFIAFWNNDMYYVVGCGDFKETVLKFRIDRMIDLSISEDERVSVPDGYDISDFFEKEFSMMAGNTSTVELLCENRLMGSVIDKFGEDVRTEVVDEGHFKATVDVELSGVFFGWVVASRGAMRIVGPEDVFGAFEEVINNYLAINQNNNSNRANNSGNRIF